MEGGDQAERQVRAARNQALFRLVNERLQGLAEAFQFIAQRTSFACECADLSCVEQLSLSLEEYEELRTRPAQFVVLPGHVYPEVERVVTENERFVIVRKIGKGAEVAAEFDPRAEA
jgi:hypothetical protein